VIPKDLRESLRLDTGVELTLTPLDENRILLERIPPLSELFGFLGRTKASKILLRQRESETKAESERQVELEKRLAEKREG
jgi:bifunctional DNA-binding transcriptional regulator/antitoxin component of YhaV-PrlF toxin-antitoxin module